MQPRVLPWQNATTFPNKPEYERDPQAAIENPANTPKKPGVNRAKIVSWSAWILGDIAAGGLKLAVKKFLPGMQDASDQVINVTGSVLESPGALAKSQITSPITAWIYATANKRSATEQGPQAQVFGQAIGPKLSAESIESYVERSKVDAFILGQLSEFTLYQEALEEVSQYAAERLAAGDTIGAARLLGGAMFEDWSHWGDVSPDVSPRMFELLFATLRPIFAHQKPEALKMLADLTLGEMMRLQREMDPKVNDGGAAKTFCTTITNGLLLGDAPPRLQSPWGADAAATGKISNNKHEDPKAWVAGLLDDRFDNHIREIGWEKGLKLARLRRKVVRAVTKDVKAFEIAKGRPASPDDMWRMVVDAVNADAGNRAELKAMLLNAGAYVGVAVGTSYAAQGILKHSPGWAGPGVSNIVYTMFNYLLFVGQFAIDKFNAFGTALGYAGGSRKSLGKAIEREIRNGALRPRTRDARIDVIHSYLNTFRRNLQHQIVDVGYLCRQGAIDEAARKLGGAIICSDITNYEFHPFLNLMERMYVRLGPCLDGITEAQRQELAEKAEAYCKEQGVSDDLMATYYRPFIQSMVTWNVQVDPDAPAPTPAPHASI